MALDWTDLCALGTVEMDAVLVCIHDRVGWERAANARWEGVPLESLRELVGADPAATHIVTEAADGFTISIPMAELESGGLRAYVVVGMNGRRLTVAHGAPVRASIDSGNAPCARPVRQPERSRPGRRAEAAVPIRCDRATTTWS